MDNITEKPNSKSNELDLLSVEAILSLINDEDITVAHKITPLIPELALIINNVIEKLQNQGRLFYVGCGTSGRLGVLDAAECPPTFSVDSNIVQGIIAGGDDALVKSIENAEDSFSAGGEAVENKNISNQDIVIGISASGTATFVHGALSKSKSLGAYTILICCNKIVDQSYIDKILSIIVGPEIITGSTRMKAGTATKLVLNMISTVSMIKMNKVYNNLMVDLKVNNKKLKSRAVKIINEITGENIKKCESALIKSNGNVKISVIMLALDVDNKEAEQLLIKNNGSLKSILKQ